GCDFLADFLIHLHQRLKNQPPEAMADIDIFVNAQRLKRRLLSMLSQNNAGFLPRIHLITHLHDYQKNPIASPAENPPLRRRLLLAQTVRTLLQNQPDIAPPAASYDLADSLAGLLDEMHEHGVPADIFETLTLDNQSEYWQRSLQFLNIIARYDADNELLDTHKRQKYMAEHYEKLWQTAPPQNPVFVIGSTGSRAPTAIFMRAVARLPQGCVILPGFDRDLPDAAWQALQTRTDTFEHSQSALARFLKTLDISPKQIPLWGEAKTHNRAREQLVSLALRPAPLSDQWYKDGRAAADDLPHASADITMVEANDDQEEALSIALILRHAIEDKK
ncbi:MAG: double-strand break repair protein AddB, partial [Proteobacteria bacterium]|nr:double-strand break repair protein AddB [Pseudomonadota bacterium]